MSVGIRVQRAGDRPAVHALEVPVDAGELDGRSPPKPLMRAAIALALLTLVLSAVAKRTGAGRVEPAASPVVAQQDLRFEDAAGGVVRVVTAGAAPREVALLPGGSDMFIRSSVRALARDRRRSGGVLEEGAFRLTRHASGRMTLEDLVTSERIELNAFGPTNLDAWRRLLDAAGQ